MGTQEDITVSGNRVRRNVGYAIPEEQGVDTMLIAISKQDTSQPRSAVLHVHDGLKKRVGWNCH